MDGGLLEKRLKLAFFLLLGQLAIFQSTSPCFQLQFLLFFFYGLHLYGWHPRESFLLTFLHLDHHVLLVGLVLDGLGKLAESR